jgi:uncharacterized membrane protein (DUF485 family)
MPGFDTGPNEPQAYDAQSAGRNARYGAILFLLYLLLYGAFVGINAFDPGAMDTVVVAGVNLAVIYGLGLILAAFVLALIYGWLCRAPVPAKRKK